MIQQKLAYCRSDYDVKWYITNLTAYTLKLNSKETISAALNSMNNVAERVKGKNDLLDLYLYKGFLMWFNDDISSALEVYQLKINDSYEGSNMPFRKQIAAQMKVYKSQGIVFPKDKETLKQIKKMKA